MDDDGSLERGEEYTVCREVSIMSVMAGMR